MINLSMCQSIFSSKTPIVLHKFMEINIKMIMIMVVYDRNHLFGLGSDTETETENWPKLLADTETNRNHKILNWKALHQGVCKKFSCHVNYQNIYAAYH